MSYFRRKRRRDEARRDALPEVIGRPYPSETVVQTGGPISRPRRSLPRRESTDPYDWIRKDYGGYGAPSPMLSRTLVRRPVLRSPKVVIPGPTPLLQAPISLWRAARVMRMDPAVKECVGRRIRKQVLFAKKVAGYRHRSPGKGGYKRNRLSGLSCV